MNILEGIHKQRVTILVLASFLVVGAVFMWPRIRCEWHWRMIKMSDNDATSIEHATAIMDTECGLRKAVKDIGVYGGETKGMGSWILVNSPRVDMVKKLLDETIASDKKSASSRCEAAWLMWELTGEIEYIKKMQKVATDSGNANLMKISEQYSNKANSSLNGND